MQTPHQSSKATPSSQSVNREQTIEAFRQFLRQTDKLIKEGQFALAKIQVAEAKKIDPRNPFIAIFEERIALFEKKITPELPAADLKTSEVNNHTDIHFPPQGIKQTIDTEHENRELLEQKLRLEIEAEFKARFTEEVRQAEFHTSKILEEERTKWEIQHQALTSKYEQMFTDAQARLELDYQQKLTEETERAEKKLYEQFQEKLLAAEQRTRSELIGSFESERQQMEERLKREQEELLNKERKAFQDRELGMKVQFDKRLLEALRKTESVIREQSKQELELSHEQLRQQLTAEFQAVLKKEHETIRIQYEEMKTKNEESFASEQNKMDEESQQKMKQELEALRQREQHHFEEQRNILRQELENELQTRYQNSLNIEQQRIQSDAEKMIEAEKKRMQDEYTTLLAKQDERIRTARLELKNEMEKNFLKQTEQIAREYDYKMELLGAKAPETTEEKHALYRNKVRQGYLNGQPTVEESKKIIELKELLNLSLDEHLAIETDVRLELYTENVEQQITSGMIDLQNPKSLDELKQQFRITSEESSRLEPFILSSFQRLAVKGRILLVDDDLMLLQSMDSLLTDYGYQVIPSASVKDALEQLEATSVDLILSDIMFGEEELDGFQFFSAVQAQPRLQKIPFIFMSALRDGVIIRSGVQLGADDYLTKPVDPDLLLAVIEGKLKRYRNFEHA